MTTEERIKKLESRLARVERQMLTVTATCAGCGVSYTGGKALDNIELIQDTDHCLHCQREEGEE